MKHLFKCDKCGKYTMKEICDCGCAALAAKPIKYSPNDKFSSYRRQAKINEYAKRGLL